MSKPERISKPPFPASRTAPYIFVSYSHADAADVYPELIQLKGQGYNIWYDEGISPGHDWPEELAIAIEACAMFLLFVTPQSARSENCIRETTFAMTRGRPFLAVHLEKTQLPRGLELSIGHSQAILKYAIDEETYRGKLQSAVIGKLGLEEAPPPTRVETAARPESNRNRLILMGAVAVAALGGAAFLLTRDPGTAAELTLLRQMVDSQTANIGVSEASTLQSYLVARKLAASAHPPDALAPLWEKVSVTGRADSSPEHVDISLKASIDDAEWIAIGVSDQPGFSNRQ